MENLNLTLTVNEVNLILRSLGQHPFVEIADLIGKIKQQGDVQLAEQQKAAEEAKASDSATPVEAEAPAAE
jgi:hypothetical protein